MYIIYTKKNKKNGKFVHKIVNKIFQFKTHAYAPYKYLYKNSSTNTTCKLDGNDRTVLNRRMQPRHTFFAL